MPDNKEGRKSYTICMTEIKQQKRVKENKVVDEIKVIRSGKAYSYDEKNGYVSIPVLVPDREVGQEKE